MNSALITRQVHLQEGASMLKACSKSGMSVKAWLRENGISRDKYYYWKRKLKDICLDELCPSFVEIAAVPVLRKKIRPDQRAPVGRRRVPAPI